MLRKKNRLSREAFSRFFSIGKRHTSPSLQLLYTPHTDFHGAVVVSKKVDRKAVQRNTLRRKIYDLLRKEKNNHQLTGVHILLVKKQAKEQNIKELGKEMEDLIGRAHNTR